MKKPHISDKSTKSSPATGKAMDKLRYYLRGERFSGKIGLTTEDSEPAWPKPIHAQDGAPNVLVFVLDDTGFGNLGCYGSPINTPNLDKLAKNGLLYNNMHTTALCSPTRSCVLTGRNHHSNAMAGITEISTGYPGYNGNIPFENGFLSETLLQEGYNTFAIGKWHLTPAEQTSAAGPYDRWPLGRGFERYYGFMGGDTHQYYPDLVYDNHQVEPPKTPKEGYHLSEDLTDKAIEFIMDSKQIATEKPFFLYYCTGAMHAPHHVHKDWADKYKGMFDDGWDAYREKTYKKQLELGVLPKGTKLSARDPDVQEWSALSDQERKLYARMMEVFAGFLEYTDQQFGRVLEALKDINQLDNTIVMVISDNGASAEGGPEGSVNENKFFNLVPESIEENAKAMEGLGGPDYFNHYPWGWAWAGNTPFKRWKRETYRGGTSDPFLVHWPKGIKAKGEVRDQYAHVIDIVPTLLDALNVKPPHEIGGATQSPIEGVSFAHTFNSSSAKSKRDTQYFEMFAHRSIYHNGWRAVCPYPGPSFTEGEKKGIKLGDKITMEMLRELDRHGWELYHLDEDFSETKNVAEQHPDILLELVIKWYVEAARYNVLPLDGTLQTRLSEVKRPELTKASNHRIYFPNTQGVPFNAAPNMFNQSHKITAFVDIRENSDEGVLLSQGGVEGGYVFYVKDGKLHYVHNYVAQKEFYVESDKKVSVGKHKLKYEFEATGKPDIKNGKGAPGIAKLYIDDKKVGETKFEYTTPMAFGISGGLACGRDQGSPVTKRYKFPFTFTGKLYYVALDVAGKETTDPEAKVKQMMANQ